MILNNAGDKKIVVAGDPLQLEPVSAKSKDVIAQNWFSQNLYSYLGMTTMKGITPFCAIGSMTLLNEQTRMRKGICEIVSKMFYDGLLIGDRNNEKMDFSAAGLPSDDIVMIDPDVGGELYGFNRFYKSNFPNTNTQSAGRVMEIVSRLIGTNPTGRKLDILIISPFRNQVSKVYSSKINTYKSNKDVTIRCSTVHSAQGDEADIVIFDLVNPTSSFISNQDASHLWCVACSRAKEKLLIVGNKAKMKNAYFSAWITYLLEHKKAA
jgi:superfamily I DNA and/or RNA helicase